MGSSPIVPNIVGVAKPGKAIDFGSIMHGFKSHHPKNSHVSLEVKYPAFTGESQVRILHVGRYDGNGRHVRFRILCECVGVRISLPAVMLG